MINLLTRLNNCEKKNRETKRYNTGLFKATIFSVHVVSVAPNVVY